MLMKSGWNRGGRSRKSMNGKRRREKRTERWEKKRRKSSGPSGKGLRCWNGILCDHGLSFQSHHQMMKTAHPTQSQRQSSTGTLDSLAHAFIILQSIPGPKTSLGSYVVHLVLKMLVLPLRNHCVLCPQVWHAICCCHMGYTALQFFPPEDCTEALEFQRKKGVLRYLGGPGAAIGGTWPCLLEMVNFLM